MADLGILAQLLANKDQEEAQKAAPDGGVIAPIQGAQVAARPVGLYTDEQRAKLGQVMFDRAVNPSAGGVAGQEEAKLVNAAPDWYKGSAPPKSSTGLGLADAGLNALAQGRQKWADTAAANPLRSMAMKQGDQQAATRASILGGLVNLLANKPQQDYASEQNAALKQAQMQRVLPGRRSTAAEEGAGAAAAMAADTRLKELAERQRLAAGKEEVARQENDPNSDKSKKLTEIAVQTGLLRPEDAGQYSYAQLIKMRPALMQYEHENWRGIQGDRERQNQEADRIEAQNREQLAQVEKEKRAEEQRSAEYALPGRVWSGAPPSADVAKEARELDLSRTQLKESAQHLSEIQAKLNSQGFLQAVGGNYRPIEGLAATPEQKQLIEEAKKWQRFGSDAYRKFAAFGTLTGKDKELADEMVATVGTPEGWSVGPQSWKALTDVVDQSTETKLSHMGSLPEGDPRAKPNPILSTPVEKRIHKFQAPSKVPYSREPQLDYAPNDGTAAPQAQGGSLPPASVGETGDTPVGVFSIKTSNGMSTPRPLTRAQVEALTQKYGAENVVNMGNASR